MSVSSVCQAYEIYVYERLLWTLAQRSLSEVHVLFCECYFILFIFKRLTLL